MMPATLYLRFLLTAFLRRNWAWGIVIVSFFVGLGYFTDQAVYVAVILFFAAIPAGIFHFFVTRLTRSRRASGTAQNILPPSTGEALS